MARPTQSETLIELFLDMLAAERGGARNTLAAYARDLADLSEPPRRRRQDPREGDERRPARLYRRAGGARLRAPHRWRAGSPPSASSTGFSTPRAIAATIPRRCSKAPSAADRSRRSSRWPRSTGCLSARMPPRPILTRRGPRACAPRGSPVCSKLLYATGLRVSELVELPVSAARRDQRVLIIRGKGGKERLVPLNDAAKRAMAHYLALVAEAGRASQSKWLFPSFGESGHLTRQHFARDLKALAAAAGLRRGPGKPARAAPRLRQPPAAERRRPARGADAARPLGYFDHADLHPRAGGAAQEPGARPASAGGGVSKSPLAKPCA